MKHTRGPWRVDSTRAFGAYGVWTDYATHPGHDRAGYPSQICAMPDDVTKNRNERDANAILIAAAPELLEACELLAGPVDSCEEFERLAEWAQGIIKKAKGEA